MMSESEKLDFTQAVFTALVSEKQDRLNRGRILRQGMMDAIRRGEKPQGYRPQWIREQSAALVKVLGQMAVTFDASHPDDKCSVGDLLDVLATTQALFRKKG